MNRLQKLLSLLLLFNLYSFSQVTNEGLPSSWSLASDELSLVEANILPSFDLQSIKEEDKKL